jgi:hypothetical protein
MEQGIGDKGVFYLLAPVRRDKPDQRSASWALRTLAVKIFLETDIANGL